MKRKNEKVAWKNVTDVSMYQIPTTETGVGNCSINVCEAAVFVC